MSYQIRLAQKADVAQMLKIYTPFVMESAVSFEETPPSEAEFWHRVETTCREAPWLVCCDRDKVAGYAYAGKHRKREAYRWTRELSVYVHPEFRKRRIATALYHSLIELLKVQGYTNALIGITLPNPASVRFHENFGFRPVGIYHKVGIKLGHFYDVGWWEMALSGQLPPRLQTLDEIIDARAWQDAIESGIAKIRKV